MNHVQPISEETRTDARLARVRTHVVTGPLPAEIGFRKHSTHLTESHMTQQESTSFSAETQHARGIEMAPRPNKEAARKYPRFPSSTVATDLRV